MYSSSDPVYAFFFFKHNTAYEMRISDWSSDVCSSDLRISHRVLGVGALAAPAQIDRDHAPFAGQPIRQRLEIARVARQTGQAHDRRAPVGIGVTPRIVPIMEPEAVAQIGRAHV